MLKKAVIPAAGLGTRFLPITKNTMKKTIVTGGAGFIGSHLCEYLIEKGDKVICIDNLITGSTPNL
jgi:UTP-glucose-1-phosphate uridylyltransferase